MLQECVYRENIWTVDELQLQYITEEWDWERLKQRVVENWR